MMRALWSLLRQDALLSWRNGLVLVTIITLVVIVALYWVLPFLLPQEIELGGGQVYMDATEDESAAAFLRIAGADDDALAVTREELLEQVEAEAGATGVIISGTRREPRFELVFANEPSVSLVRVAKANLRSLAAAISGSELGAPIRVQTIRPGSPSLAANESLIAVMIAFEVMILGFLFVAVVVFGEKREGSVYAYRVTPAGLLNYVVSKTLVFSIMSSVYGVILVLATVGFTGAVLRILPLLLLACSMMTLLGLAIAVFFKNISEWFVPGVVVLALNMLAILPYQIPTFSARVLTWLPGYAVIFSATEILFPSGKGGTLGEAYLTLAIWFAAAAAVALPAVNRAMMKEA